MDHTPFEYGGLHFIPEQRFEPAGQSHSIIPLSHIRQGQNLAFPGPSVFAYSHDAFYKASATKDCDIFRCVENGQLYVPCEDGLRLYEEPPDRERGGGMGGKVERGSYHAVSLSGGKDSTAMLLLMIERDMPIDVVLTADTGMEFPEMYEHLQKLDDLLCRERGIHITTLRHPHGFEWLMFEEPKTKPSSIENRQRLGVSLYGNGWPGVRVRWCTGQLKTHLIAKEVNRLKKERNALHYVGIAADEPKRIKNEQYPLMDWGITEMEALKISYDRGFDWGGLYEIYHRCSCWCCPLQRIDELRKLRLHHPELWARLQEMDRRAIEQFGYNPLGRFKQNWTVEQLERRFANEERQISVSVREER